MDVFDAIENRFSARQYLNKPVEEQKLHQILNAARLAPSASNRQEWRFVVVRQPDTLRQLASAANEQSFVGTAPVVIACLAQTDLHVMSCGQQSYPIDVAIAISHMTLAATALGLGTCWIGAFDETKIRNLLDVPAQMKIVELLTLGYPTKQPGNKHRLSLDEIVRYEKWTNK